MLKWIIMGVLAVGIVILAVRFRQVVKENDEQTKAILQEMDDILQDKSYED
jgi:hypothetical protein